MLSDLHHLAEQIERHTWSQIIHAPSDWQRSLEHKERADKLWLEVLEWRKTLEEQTQVAKAGNGVDRSKLCLSG